MELLVVVAVIALLTAAVPALISAGRAGAEARTFAELLGNDLRTARLTALLRGHEVRVIFDIPASRYRIEATEASRSWPASVKLSFLDPTGVPLSQSAELRFAPDGSSNGGMIRVSAGKQVHTVVDHSFSGRISVDE